MVISWFKEKSNLVKCLVFLLVILIIVLTALFVILVVRKDDHVCHSESCVEAAAELIRRVDQSASPCDDFRAFSCGAPAAPPEPEEELRLTVAGPGPADGRPLLAQRRFFRACADLGALELDEDETLAALFYGLGDWPVLRGAAWDGARFDRLLGFGVQADEAGVYALEVRLPAARRVAPAEMAPRKELLTDVAELMGAPKYLAHYETAETVVFEDELAALVEKHRQRKKEKTAQPPPKLTVNELQTLWPDIQWLELFNNVTGNRMSGHQYVFFDVLDYVRDLNKLILGTPKRIVADFVMWKTIEESWPYLSRPIRDKFENYSRRVLHLEPEPDRQEFCVGESRRLFPLVAESAYVRRHVTERKRQTVRDVLFNVRQRFVSTLESSWLGRDVKKRSLLRAQNVKFLVGGPEEVFDQFRFAENLGLYGFGFKSSNVIEMLNERRARFYDKYFSVINRGITNNTVEFYEKVINITAFSLINEDTIVIPAALLRDSFYNPNLPNYLNYATLGKALAREIFEYIFERTNGSLMGEDNGHYERRRVSDPFQKSIECLVREASIFHNSELRSPENVRDHLADFVAADVAYEAYNSWLRFSADEFTLPGLKFTPHQLFWIQSGRSSCRKVFEKHQRDSDRFKIVAALRNSRNFGDDFSCSEGSRMNSKRKCRIL